MRLCRFATDHEPLVRVGLSTAEDTLLDLTDAGVPRMAPLLERTDLAGELLRLSRAGLPEHPLDRIRLLTPVESQEVVASSRELMDRRFSPKRRMPVGILICRAVSCSDSLAKETLEISSPFSSRLNEEAL